MVKRNEEGSMSAPEAQGHRHVRLPRLNFRPVLVAAAGMLCGIFVYGACAFSSGVITGACVFALALFFLCCTGGRRRVLAVFGVFCAFALAGAGLSHLSARRYAGGPPAGEYAVTGTVEFAAVGNGYTSVTLSSLTLDGQRAGGKMTASLSGEDVRVGDILAFSARVERSPLPAGGNSYAENDFANGIRYIAAPADYTRTGRTANIFLRINGALYDVLYARMEKDVAGFSYALLTGNMRVMDEDFAEATRTGGIAHVFAVSGMHIGLLYGVVMALLRRPCGRWAVIPALALSAAYCAMCAFTVSSVRSLLMCGFAGGARFFGKKYDDLSSLSLAALATLLVSPEQYFSVSFRLSYGAMAGIFLLAGPLSRGLKRTKLPPVVAECLVSGAASQCFTLPVLMETFGYLSVWGTLMNLLVIPALPVLFFPLAAGAFLSLVLPFAAGVLLALPEGILSCVLLLFTVADVSYVLAGFSLGAGAGVWLALNVPLSERLRLRPLPRAALCAVLGLFFALGVFLQNAVGAGCRIDVASTDRGTCALVRGEGHAVLIIDGEASLSVCTDFLRRTYGGELDAVVALSGDTMSAVNTALFVHDGVVRTAYPVEAGLRVERVESGDFAVGEMQFCFEGADCMTLAAEGCVVEVCLSRAEGVLGADFFAGTGAARLKCFVKDGIIKVL